MRNTTPDGVFTRIELFNIASDSFCTIDNEISLVQRGVSRVVDAGHERLADAEPNSGTSYGALNTATARMYPIAWVHTLLLHWDRIQEIVQTVDAGYRVRFLKPHFLSGYDPSLVELEFDANGIVVQYALPEYPNFEPIRFGYDSDYPDTLMVPADDWVLDQLKWHTMKKIVLLEAPPDAFDFDRLERFAVEYKTNYEDMTVAEVNSNRAKAGFDPLPMDPLIQEALDAAQGTKSRWRMPLIAGGGIAIAIGLFAMWRRHAA